MRNGAQKRAAQPLPLHGDADVLTLAVDVFTLQGNAHLRRNRPDHQPGMRSHGLGARLNADGSKRADRAGNAEIFDIRTLVHTGNGRFLRAVGKRDGAFAARVFPNVLNALFHNRPLARAVQKARGNGIQQLRCAFVARGSIRQLPEP